MVALHGDDDQLFVRLVQILPHAPGLPIGGVLVEEYIVPVKHVHHAIAALGVGLIGFRQVDISPARRIAGQLRDRKLPFSNHGISFPLPLFNLINF